jgi:hypothetical protein
LKWNHASCIADRPVAMHVVGGMDNRDQIATLGKGGAHLRSWGLVAPSHNGVPLAARRGRVASSNFFGAGQDGEMAEDWTRAVVSAGLQV